MRDFLRVAVVEAKDRWVVQVLEPKLRGYLGRRTDLVFPARTGETFTIRQEGLEALPRTALEAIGPIPWLLPVTAECVVASPVDVDLGLFAYRVLDPPPGAAATSLIPVASVPEPARRPLKRKSGGARGEILAAIEALTSRSGTSEVSLQQVVDEMRHRGSGYAESTVRTMVSSHMCAQVHGPNIGTFDDLDRVGRGEYRMR